MDWVVVVPVKELAVAKTRLAPLPAEVRADLALAMALDVVAAARAVATAVLVVTNDVRAAAAAAEAGAMVVPDLPDAGLNPALADGARLARGWHPRAGVAAVSSDLPAVRAAEFAKALAAASAHPRALVTDAAGGGTTVLTAGPGVDLAPDFGAGSRHRHVAAGVVELAGDWPGLRRDVDTLDDLRAAETLGLGARTAAALAAARPDAAGERRGP